MDVFGLNQPSLPTPFCSGLVSVFCPSTIFHSINFPDSSPLSHTVFFFFPGLISALLVLSNEVLPQDTMHLIQRPCYQRGSPCQDPTGNRTTRRPPDHRKETQTAVIWSCLPFIRSGQNHLARHSERGGETRQTEEEGENNFREWTDLEGRGEQNKWRKLVGKLSVVPQRPSQLGDR